MEKNMFVHNSTNLRHAAIRVIIALAATFGFRVWSQDVLQTYLQSTEQLRRDVYVCATKEFGLESSQLFKLLKPLYGLADSGDYWHVTFADHLRQQLGMTPATGDHSLFFKTFKRKLIGLIGAYVDDTIGAGNRQFMEESKISGQNFQSKPRTHNNFQFAGIHFENIEEKYLLHQKSYARRIRLLSNGCRFSEFRSKKQELAWHTLTWPDLAAVVNQAV